MYIRLWDRASKFRIERDVENSLDLAEFVRDGLAKYRKEYFEANQISLSILMESIENFSQQDSSTRSVELSHPQKRSLIRNKLVEDGYFFYSEHLEMSMVVDYGMDDLVLAGEQLSICVIQSRESSDFNRIWQKMVSNKHTFDVF